MTGEKRQSSASLSASEQKCDVSVVPKKHILIVEDEEAVRKTLSAGLQQAGYAVSEASCRTSLMQRLNDEPRIDLITLDLMLGSENGLLIARQVRAQSNIPIVMITGRSAPIDRVTGLEHGADDYIVKPFHIREVCMRIENVLRRYALEDRAEAAARRQEEERLGLPNATVDVGRREVLDTSGVVMPLTDAEFDILVLFARNPGRVLSRDDLAMLLRGRSWSPLDRTIDGHIARLRKKIEPDAATPTLIKTVWRVGYVFVGEVRRLA